MIRLNLTLLLFVAACRNRNNTVQENKDSLDSIARVQKQQIHSAAEKSHEQIDSIEKAKKERVNSTTKAKKKAGRQFGRRKESTITQGGYLLFAATTATETFSNFNGCLPLSFAARHRFETFPG